MVKQVEKKKAVMLRMQGKTYNEILEQVSVSKSTLSIWLRDVGLATKQNQKLSSKKRAAQQRGGDRRREMRLLEEQKCKELGKQDIENITDHELFLIGVALYWAEGTKKSGARAGSMVDFANSDPAMVALFIAWLRKCCGVKIEDLVLRLHLHENHRLREKEIKENWSNHLQLPQSLFGKTAYKIHTPKTNRYKIGDNYIGLVSVRVKKSTRLNRRIMGWIYAIITATK